MDKFNSIVGKIVGFIINPTFLFSVVVFCVILAIIGAITGYGVLWTFLATWILNGVIKTLAVVGVGVFMIYAWIVNPITGWIKEYKAKKKK